MTADISKYALARQEIELLLKRADDAEIEKSEALLALLVSVVEAYRNSAGKDQAIDALKYELGDLAGST
ncbi:MAG: hypothetical protein VX211_06920, partial [Pseudomonadota bacterium]|nr:hypothetical protein [Pseudomonadota bacterium]